MTEQDFIKGNPAAYISFSGDICVARFLTATDNGLGASSLKIANERGKTLRHVIMGEAEARTFFINLNAKAA